MRKKLLAAVAAGGVLVSGGTAAAVFAATRGTDAQPAMTVAATTTVPWAQGPLAQLVAKGTISQAQANAIHNALLSYLRQHMPDLTRNGTPPMLAAGGPLTAVLPQLVKDGSITQAQADAVKAAITQQVQQRWHDGGPGWSGPGGYGRGMMGGGPMGPWWSDSTS